MMIRTSRRFRRHLALGVCSAALAAAALPSVAQEASELQEIVITGSRIPRPNLENNTPTTVVSEELLESQGLENFADVAATLPQFSASFGTSRTQSTFSGALTSGLNTTNLRNLGPQRSLVLVNGRRAVDGIAGGGGVDFGTLTTANIERVEIITGGASAVYGADAVAGVVNLITKKDFEGVEVGFSYGASEEGDNENPNMYALFGTKLDGGKGHLTVTVEYDDQGLVSCADRFLCAEDVNWTNPANFVRGPTARSGVPLGGRYFVPGVAGPGFVTRNGSITDANGNLIPFVTATDGYNRNARRTLAIPTERALFAAEAEYELFDGVKAFTEVNYGSTNTDAPFEGHPFQSNSDTIGNLEPSIPVNNPFIPGALRAIIPAGAQEITWWQRFEGLGDRGAQNERQTTRIVAGLRGDFGFIGDVGADWTWEASYVYGKHTSDGIQNGLVRLDRLYHSLRVEADPANPGQFRCTNELARAEGCVPVNPFAPYAQAMRNYVTENSGQRGGNELQDALFYVAGPVLDLPAGELRVSLGAEFRDFAGFVDYDEGINRGLTTGNQTGDTDLISTTTREAFAEAIVPIVTDLPFAERITAEFAYRISDTQGISDNYDTWRYGGEWVPFDGLKLRANRARAVRTPLPGELSGTGTTAGVVSDPCTATRRGENATRAANCAADGIPASYTPPLVVEQNVQGLSGANGNLAPEVAITTTFGFVFTPEFLPDFALTVDRFEIELEGIIANVDRQTRTNLCYDTTDRRFCSSLRRGTNPLVPGANYVLLEVDQVLENVAELNVKGIDVEATYAFDVADLMSASEDYGRINLRAALTFYDEASYLPLEGQPPIDFLAAGGTTSLQGFLERQGNFDLGYAYGPFRFGWTTRWIGESKMSPYTSAYPDVPSHFYHNTRVAYDVSENIHLYAGINNVFDKQPPFFGFGTSGTQALDTIPAYYDVFGRSYYAGLRVTF